MSGPPHRGDAVVEQAWQHLLGRWDSSQAHDAFLELSAQRGQLGYAARRYREEQTARPEDPEPERMLSQLLARSMAELSVERKPGLAPTSRRALWGFLIMAAVAALAALAIFRWVQSTRSPAEPTPGVTASSAPAPG